MQFQFQCQGLPTNATDSGSLLASASGSQSGAHPPSSSVSVDSSSTQGVIRINAFASVTISFGTAGRFQVLLEKEISISILFDFHEM